MEIEGFVLYMNRILLLGFGSDFVFFVQQFGLLFVDLMYIYDEVLYYDCFVNWKFFKVEYNWSYY